MKSEHGIVVALEHAETCFGTTVYLGGRQIACFADAFGAQISPDGSRIALARHTGVTGEIKFFGSGADILKRYEIVIFDVGSGIESVVMKDALGEQPPEFTWNSISSHLLVRWPVRSGL